MGDWMITRFIWFIIIVLLSKNEADRSAFGGSFPILIEDRWASRALVVPGGAYSDILECVYEG